ncbi:S4 domain-containing protein [Rhodococcus sp. NPDC003318]|uniref:S4 domain-containing protein n=1 Tax=Rhodococcus sp. NPDC003318 TaxID=3364503 RepID=UPI003691C575
MNDALACRPVRDVLLEQNPHVAPAQASALVMEGLVLVNGRPARHPGQLVRPTDRVTVAGAPTPVRPRLVAVA